ncbi:MAG: hypothetical protein ABL959_14650 [Pyrinomonadaceae bacterium]
MPTHKELSKTNWSRESGQWPGVEIIQSGALQRIADAAEIMAESSKSIAANYNRLLADKEWYERAYRERGVEIERLKHSRAGYMAALTKLRNKIS